MASPELQTVLEILRANPPLQGTDIHAMRASMSSATGNLPRPDDVSYEPVDAGGVPAEWTTATGADPGRAIVYLHGGAYAVGSIDSHRMLVSRIARASGARVLSVDYRLGPEHPHPAAVEDAVAAFRFVVDGGVSPGSIAFAGDSAGGGLTIAACLALRDAGGATPAAGICLTPWLDLTLSSSSMLARGDHDPLYSREQLRIMGEAYLAGADPKTPQASPLFAKLEGLPPILIQAGTGDALIDDSTSFHERAQAAGVDIELDVWPDMIHVWHAFADLLPEGVEAIDKLADFYRRKTD